MAEFEGSFLDPDGQPHLLKAEAIEGIIKQAVDTVKGWADFDAIYLAITPAEAGRSSFLTKVGDAVVVSRSFGIKPRVYR